MISTRADLDAQAGTQTYADFMTMLAGTIWRLERDDAAQCWVAVPDDSVISRFGFSRADFPDASPPVTPPWTPVVQAVPGVVSMGQARLALHRSGYLETVNAAIASMPGPEGEEARIEWEFRQSVERTSPLVQQLGTVLELTESQLDELFILAASL